MRDKKKRLPKLEYFKLRYTEAVTNGHTDKAAYYAKRIKGLEAQPQPESKRIIDKDAMKARIKAKFDTLTESEKLIEANKFYKAMEGKVTMNEAHAFMADIIGGTLATHAMTF